MTHYQTVCNICYSVVAGPGVPEKEKLFCGRKDCPFEPESSLDLRASKPPLKEDEILAILRAPNKTTQRKNKVDVYFTEKDQTVSVQVNSRVVATGLPCRTTEEATRIGKEQQTKLRNLGKASTCHIHIL